MFENFKLIYILWIFLIIINLITFVLYAVDKRKAQKEKWRIPEKTLILFCFAGGALGGLLGMYVCHHKTKHTKFRILVPLSLVLWLGLNAFAVYLQYFK